jgi:hypothetical protein
MDGEGHADRRGYPRHGVPQLFVGAQRSPRKTFRVVTLARRWHLARRG